jgi:hypothetical protein
MHRGPIPYAVLARFAALLVFGGPLFAAQSPPVSRPPGRILGVFDALTALPLEGADVVDMMSGTTAVTTTTGTVTLGFLPDGFALLRVRKIGFEATTVPVVISASDTAPITVLLMRVGQILPGVEATTVRAPADTVRQLIANGFYARKRTSGAPSEAFVTSEQLSKAGSLRDLRSLSGRALCTTNLYIDGNRVDSASAAPPPAPGGTRRGRGADTLPPTMRPPAGSRQSPDQTLGIELIAGVETYHGSEIPPQFAGPQRSTTGQACASLIWTK